jgi:mono/diheme cytochrome c family protein
MQMKRILTCAPLLGLVLLGGCDRQMRFSPIDMWNRSRYKPLEPEPFFADGSSSRPLPQGTVARGQLRIDETLYQGRKRGTGVASNYIVDDNGGGQANANPASARSGGNGVDRARGDNGLGTDATLATEFPFPVTAKVLSRGHERFNIYCAPCHGGAGDADGIIVRRGFSPPPSFHIDRLRKAPVGHYFDVITHGYGAMYSYASRVEPRDRWAIIAYIRLLQESRAKAGIKTPQMDTPRSDASPGAVVMEGSNGPGMPHNNLSSPHKMEKATAKPEAAKPAAAPSAGHQGGAE